ncbi:hypothetical protein PHYBLDRAFT_169397 [Phycomyces blakesleeanus NRRL 1555(-)]|uniref:Uncharacterized protein n=2 Tax=Phycomyces blakesleeanus TaxID=4837 RepID=A0A162PRM2_PHYB8|nr:hypothetical protein PHYBLDRAFT_169397 [Phycomyces blakesleeanus NRRL 1555(-)]OAD72256.1 hypothetical protein PHYBLDRAFT_169397 [Phycomyces blakesleeanus NRRL 1555(-)]|eukprot:XP_018290296.1 hypothetical protein PHYBLDRAFT_169397 [Phycomyces blakesleeanus NRRL 1555(-)]
MNVAMNVAMAMAMAMAIALDKGLLLHVMLIYPVIFVLISTLLSLTTCITLMLGWVLLDNDPQLFSVDIMKSLTKQFEGFTIKKPLFEPEIRNSPENMETRFEWFMKWKNFNLGSYKELCFH